MWNNIYLRVGIALSCTGSALLISSGIQKLFEVMNFNNAPVLPGLTFFVCGVALVAVARTDRSDIM